MSSEPKGASGVGKANKTTGLAGLTEELTLDILFRLDLRSLGAVKRVCRRLARIAQDPALFRRVSLVSLVDRSAESQPPVLRTNCAELGTVLLDDREEGSVGSKFRHVLRRLVKGGAALSALDLDCDDIVCSAIYSYMEEILKGLPALLTRDRVKLKSLRVLNVWAEGLVELVRSQPTLELLDMPDFPPEAVELVRCAPNLRHLNLGDTDESTAELLRCVVPQLRSLVLRSIYTTGHVEWGESALQELLTVLRSAGKGRLLFQAAGSVFEDGLAEFVALAVEDFKPEERGADFRFWERAEQRMPRPSLEFNDVDAFLRGIAEQRRRQWAERAANKEEEKKRAAEEAQA